MKTVYFLPTWLMTRIAWSNLPQDHPWRKRGRCFTPSEWADGATVAAAAFTLQCWLVLAIMVFWIVAAFLSVGV